MEVSARGRPSAWARARAKWSASFRPQHDLPSWEFSAKRLLQELPILAKFLIREQPCLIAFINVALPLHLRGWSRKKTRERARELLDLVQLGHRLEHRPDELSGGERQRVAIARALAVYPPIVLADEPTGNLDTVTGGEILKLIRDLHERLGATVLLVTHDLTVARSCPRTVTLRDGRIVGDERQ